MRSDRHTENWSSFNLAYARALLTSPQALKWHPDRHIDDKEHATKVFFEARPLHSNNTWSYSFTIQVSHAYQTLAGELDFSSIPTASEASPMFAILPTPQLSSQASTESAGSVTSSSRIFTMRTSNISSSRTTPTSSLGGSVNTSPKSSTREAYTSWQRNIHRSPIGVPVSSQATEHFGGSDVPISHHRLENPTPSARTRFEFTMQDRHLK